MELAWHRDQTTGGIKLSQNGVHGVSEGEWENEYGSLGSPAGRGAEDIASVTGRTWIRAGRDGGQWHKNLEAYTQCLKSGQ